MRTASTAALIAFVGVAGGVAAWAGLRAMARDPAHAIGRTGKIEPIPLTQPTGRTLQRGFARPAADMPPCLPVCTPALVEVTAAVSGSSGGGLGVFDGRTHALLRWLELPAGERTLPVALGPIPVGGHRLVFASSPERARYSYAAQTTLVVELKASASQPAAVIDGDVHDVLVTIELADPQSIAPPIVPELRRTDDAAWHLPRGHAGYAWQGGQLRLAGLGAGEYQLFLHGVTVTDADRDRLTFRVPEVLRLGVRCSP